MIQFKATSKLGGLKLNQFKYRNKILEAMWFGLSGWPIQVYSKTYPKESEQFISCNKRGRSRSRSSTEACAEQRHQQRTCRSLPLIYCLKWDILFGCGLAGKLIDFMFIRGRIDIFCIFLK